MNSYLAISPFRSDSSSILAYSSQQNAFPATFVQDDTHAKRRWKTTGTGQATLDFDMGGVTALDGVYINNPNFPALRVLSSPDAVTWHLHGPNLILKSHNQEDTSGWPATSTTATRTAGYADGPVPNRSKAVRVEYAGAGYIAAAAPSTRAVAGITFTFTIWARSTSGASQQVFAVAVAGTTVTEQAYTLTGAWQKLQVSAVGAGSSAAPACRVRVATASADVLLWGGQLSVGSSPLLATYQTDANGVVIPVSERTGRRQMYLDLTGWSDPYTRILIPASQVTDDGDSAYAMGGVSLFDNVEPLYGKHQFPFEYEIPWPETTTEFEGAGSETLTLGDSRVVLSMDGQRVASKDLPLFMKLARLKPGRKVLVIENVWYPDGPREEADMTAAYICKVSSPNRFRHAILPELFERPLQFTELL